MVRLEPLQADHLDHVMTWVNDRRVMRFFANRQTDISREDEARFIANIDHGVDHVFSIFHDVPDGKGYTRPEYVGQCALHVDFKANEGRLFVAIAFDHQGHGYASEAVRKLLDYGWDALQIARVTLLVRVDNYHARGMYLKLGFTLGGLQKRVYKLGDEMLDMFSMSVANPRVVRQVAYG